MVVILGGGRRWVGVMQENGCCSDYLVISVGCYVKRCT